MGKAAVDIKPTTFAGHDRHNQRSFAVYDANNHMVSAALGMSWQLAIAVVLPLVGGVQADARYGTAPSLTSLGIIIAVIGAVVVVRRTVRDVQSVQQAHGITDSTKRNKE